MASEAGMTYSTEGAEHEGMTNEQKASQLPKPSGYHMLVGLVELKEQTEGGIYIPEARLADERAASIVGLVLKQGPDCYKSEKKFPTGPWCKRGTSSFSAPTLASVYGFTARSSVY